MFSHEPQLDAKYRNYVRTEVVLEKKLFKYLMITVGAQTLLYNLCGPAACVGGEFDGRTLWRRDVLLCKALKKKPCGDVACHRLAAGLAAAAGKCDKMFSVYIRSSITDLSL